MWKSACLAMILLCLAGPAWPEEREPIPIPRVKPHRPSTTLSQIIPIPRQKPIVKPAEPPQTTGWPDAVVRSEQAACQSLLNNLEIKWTQQPPLGQQGGCGAPAPIEAASIDGVELVPPAIVTCGMAAALHEWISGAVQPRAKEVLGTSVVTIHTAASYVCRSRNNVNGAKLSEHAKANALDMSGFSFAKGKAVSVEDGWGGLLSKIDLSSGGRFLGSIRLAACKSFTTVLGPGSDPYHGTHFHVDILTRKGGYRICQ